MIAAPDAGTLAYATEKCADLLGMPRERLRRQIRAGRVHAVRIGRRLYVPANELDRLLNVRPAEGQSP